MNTADKLTRTFTQTLEILMNTIAQPCANSALPQRQTTSITARWVAAVRRFWAAWRAPRPSRHDDSQLNSLDGLSAEALKDIGAPEWLQARAYHASQRARQGGLLERDPLHWR